MSFKLSGINGLPYLGVQATTPPQLLYINRAPTVNDYKNLNVGTLWLYVGQPGNTPIELWMAATVIPGNATWILLYPGSGSGGTTQFVTDSGTAVEVAGIINVLGGTNINTAATPNGGQNVIVALNNNVSLSGTLEVTGTTTLHGNVELTNFLLGAVVKTNISDEITTTNGTDGQVFISSSTPNQIPKFATITSSDGSITFTPGSNTLDMKAAFAPGNVIVTTYNTPGADTWTKNTNTKFVIVYGWGGGNGGGSGRQGLSTAAGGGSGAGGTLGFTFSAPASFIANSQAVFVGLGGAGGATQTSINTDGNAGSPGTNSTFGAVTSIISGSLGTGGTITTAAAGNAIGQGTYNYNVDNVQVFNASSTLITPGRGSNQNGSNGFTSGSSISITVPLVGNAIVNYLMMSAQGGGGSGADAITERSAGNGGACTYVGAIAALGGAGGLESGAIDGTDGDDQLSLSTAGVVASSAGGGGGGGQSVGLVAGNAGNGGFPGGGGGGGGGSLNGTDSGTGGNGGDGLIIVLEFL